MTAVKGSVSWVQQITLLGLRVSGGDIETSSEYDSTTIAVSALMSMLLQQLMLVMRDGWGIRLASLNAVSTSHIVWAELVGTVRLSRASMQARKGAVSSVPSSEPKSSSTYFQRVSPPDQVVSALRKGWGMCQQGQGYGYSCFVHRVPPLAEHRRCALAQRPIGGGQWTQSDRR